MLQILLFEDSGSTPKDMPKRHERTGPNIYSSGFLMKIHYDLKSNKGEYEKLRRYLRNYTLIHRSTGNKENRSKKEDNFNSRIGNQGCRHPGCKPIGMQAYA